MTNSSTGAPVRTSQERQAAVVFDEVARLAACMERMGIMLVANDGEDDRDVDAYQTAITTLSCVVGLLGDMGSKLCGGLVLRGTDPEKWLLPPSYHAAGNRGERQ